MRSLIKYAAAIILVLSVFSARSQTSDSANRLRLSTYRQLYWDNLPKATDWVNDLEKLYTKKERFALDSIIFHFEKETTIEIGIVTLDTFCTSKSNFDAMIFHIMNTWGIGKKDKNNGILIGISEGHGMIRINYGDGVQQYISDKDIQELIDKYFVPQFKNGEYYAGTMNGLTKLTALLRSKIK